MNASERKPELYYGDLVVVSSMVRGEANALNGLSTWISAGSGAAFVVVLGSMPALERMIGSAVSHVLIACGAAILFGWLQRMTFAAISSEHEMEKLVREKFGADGQQNLGARKDEDVERVALRIAAWAPFPERKGIRKSAAHTYGARASWQMRRGMAHRTLCQLQAGSVFVGMSSAALHSMLSLAP